MRKIGVILLLCLMSVAQAATWSWSEKITKLSQSLGKKEVQMTFRTSDWYDIHVADSCWIEVMEMADKNVVVYTVCAPVCSSRVCVYNKEWQCIETLPAPQDMTFPQAELDSVGMIEWKENLVLDDEGR